MLQFNNKIYILHFFSNILLLFVRNNHRIDEIPIYSIAERLHIRIIHNKANCFNGHDRKTMSLSFNVKKNVWYCHGCGAGGGNYNLVMDCLDLDPRATFEWFRSYFPKYVGTASYSIPKTNNLPLKKIAPVESKFAPNPTLYRWIINNLKLSSEGLDHLVQKGIQKEVIEKMQIRDLRDPEAFLHQLQKDWTLDELIQAGLMANDPMRNRLIWWKHVLLFPFFSKNNDLIYFQGRFIKQGNGPKFINLRELSKPIYNLQHLNALPKGLPIYFMEGITDTLAALQDNFNAFGILGATSFREEYVEDFLPYAIRVIPDNDFAGMQFANSVRDTFAKFNKAVVIKKVPYAKDYCDYLKSRNAFN
jgi:DNA primase